MPEARKPTSALDILGWEPSETQKKNGKRAYASRQFGEGVKFEKAGNMVQARLRYEYVRAYCAQNQLPYPPFSVNPTELTTQINAEPLKLDAPKPFEEVAVNVRRKAKKQKIERLKAAWTPERRAAQKIHGQKLYLDRLLAAGKMDEAVAFAQKHSLASGLKHALPENPAPLSPSVGAGPLGDVPETPVVDVPAPAPAPPTENALEETHVTPLMDVSLPKSELPIENLSLREQLERQLSELDAAERLQNPIPEPIPAISQPVASAAPILPTEPVKIAPKATEKAVPGVRKALVWANVPNPRLLAIKFLDGKQELGSMFKGRRPLRINDKVDVVVARGEGATAIYEEMQKAT